MGRLVAASMTSTYTGPASADAGVPATFSTVTCTVSVRGAFVVAVTVAVDTPTGSAARFTATR